MLFTRKIIEQLQSIACMTWFEAHSSDVLISRLTIFKRYIIQHLRYLSIYSLTKFSCYIYVVLAQQCRQWSSISMKYMYLQPYIESLIEKSCIRGKLSCTVAAQAEVVPRSAECSRSFVSLIDVLVLGETKKGKSAFDLKFPFPVMFSQSFK